MKTEGTLFVFNIELCEFMFVLRETAWCRMINVKTTFREDYLD